MPVYCYLIIEKPIKPNEGCLSIEDYVKGRNVSILEFNGPGSTPNHVFTPNFSLARAHKEIMAHWKGLYEISSFNHKEGLAYWPFLKGFRFLRNEMIYYKSLRKYDKIIGYLFRLWSPVVPT